MLNLAVGLLCLFGTNVIAQNLSITKNKTEYDGAQRAAIYVKMEPATKDVKAAWKDYLKDQYDVKVEGFGFLSNKDVLKAKKVSIKDISDMEMDLNSKIISGEYGTDMMVFASFGYDLYLSPEKYAKEYEAMESLVYDFLGTYLPNHYAGQIEKSQKIVADLADAKSDLAKDIADNKEDIAKMKKEIEELTKENEKMSDELSKTKEKLTVAEQNLEARKEKVESIKAKVVEGNKEK